MSDLTIRLRRGFGGLVPPVNDEAANTIDRLRALNAELLAALKTARSAFESDENFFSNVTRQIDEAIAKADRIAKLEAINAELLAELKSVENLDYFDEDRARRLVAKAEHEKKALICDLRIFADLLEKPEEGLASWHIACSETAKRIEEGIKKARGDK